MTETSSPPRVSVVLPTFNRADLLARAARSVLEQSIDDLELIIVDDGSTDATPEVVQQLEDERVVYLHFEENRGNPVAVNSGVEVARADWIAFVDSDDEWRAAKLEKQLALVQNDPGLGVVYGEFDVERGGALTRYPRPSAQRHLEVAEQLLNGNFISPGTALVRRDVFTELGGFTSALPSLHDWDFFLRVARKRSFRFLDDVVLLAHHSPGGVNDPGDIEVAESLAGILERHADAFAEHPDIRAKHEHVIGHLLCLHQRAADGRLHLTAAARARPFSLKYVGRALLAHAGGRLYPLVHSH